MSRCRLAIFDFDGTLADSFPFFLSVFNQLAGEYRFNPVAGHEVEQLRRMNPRQLMHHVGLPAWKLPFVSRRFISLMKAQSPGILPFAGVEDALRHLDASDVALAIVSSNSQENICRVMGAQTISLFRQLECGASIFGKASRIERVLRQSGIPGDQAVYIGDQGEDARAARKARVAFGAVSWGYGSLDSLLPYQPRYLFSSPADIKNLA